MTYPRRGGGIPYEIRADIEDLQARYADPFVGGKPSMRRVRAHKGAWGRTEPLPPELR